MKDNITILTTDNIKRLKMTEAVLIHTLKPSTSSNGQIHYFLQRNMDCRTTR